MLFKRLNLNFLLLIVAVMLIATSLIACSGLTGSTSSTASNPTGLPLTSDKLAVSMPAFADVNSNCAKGDTNSCVQKSKILAFCKETSGNDEALTACTTGKWTEAIAAGAQ